MNKSTKVQKVEGGYILTVRKEEGTRVTSNAYLFNGLQEASAYANSSFA